MKTTSSGEASSSTKASAARRVGRCVRRVSADIAQSLGREGAGLLGSGDDHLVGAREEDAADFVDGFIAHGAVDQAHPAVL